MSTSTLPVRPDDRPLAVDRMMHVALWVVLGAVVALGLAGRLGVSSQVATDAAGGLELSVRHATVTRPGVSTPLEITVTAGAGLPATVTIEIGNAYVGAFDFNALSPQPAAEWGDGARDRWRFDVPEGATSLGISLDGRIDPSVQTRLSTEVVASVDGYPTVVVPIETAVLP